jgi:hypothetical protein
LGYNFLIFVCIFVLVFLFLAPQSFIHLTSYS